MLFCWGFVYTFVYILFRDGGWCVVFWRVGLCVACVVRLLRLVFSVWLVLYDGVLVTNSKGRDAIPFLNQ